MEKKYIRCFYCWFKLPSHTNPNICVGCKIQYKVKQDRDMINYPPHYTKWGIEPIDYITSNNMSFLEWNIIKYVTRYKYKNWKEDLKKAKFYLDKLIDSL